MPTPSLPLLHPSLSWAPALFALHRQLGAAWPGLEAVDGVNGPVGERLAAAIGEAGSAATTPPVLLFDGADAGRRLDVFLARRRDQRSRHPLAPPAPLLVFHDLDDGTYAAVLAWEQEQARFDGLLEADEVPDAVIVGDVGGAAGAPPTTLCTGPLAAVLRALPRIGYDRAVDAARKLAAQE